MTEDLLPDEDGDSVLDKLEEEIGEQAGRLGEPDPEQAEVIAYLEKIVEIGDRWKRKGRHRDV